jgi:hypothetical protein
VIRKDARGALVHVRRRDTGECIGCIEAGLYEVVRAVIVEEVTAPAGDPAEAIGGVGRS